MRKYIPIIIATISAHTAFAGEGKLLFKADFNQGTHASVAHAETAMLKGSATITEGQSGRNGGEALKITTATGPYQTAEYDRFHNIEFSEGTLELWYKPAFENNDAQKLHYLFDLPSEALNSNQHPRRVILVFCQEEGRQIFRAFLGEESHNSTLNVPVSWDAGEWHHIALTWNATEAVLYIDGVRSASKPISGGLFSGDQEAQDVASTSFGLGGLIKSDGTVSADGLIDDVQIWDKVIYEGDFTPKETE